MMFFFRESQILNTYEPLESFLPHLGFRFFLQGPDLPITSDTLEDVVTLMPGAPNDLGNLWRNGWVPRKI